MLIIAVRYLNSARGAAAKYRAAILDGTLEPKLLEPLSHPSGPPYRSVVTKERMGALIHGTCRDAIEELPFLTFIDAKCFFQRRLTGLTRAGKKRDTSFCAAELARDLCM